MVLKKNWLSCKPCLIIDYNILLYKAITEYNININVRQKHLPVICSHTRKCVWNSSTTLDGGRGTHTKGRSV